MKLKIKNISFVISAIIVILGVSGCDQVNVISSDVNYKECTVVRAELKADNNFEGVTFTKTLPLDEAYDIKKAELTNVTAFLIINKIQVVPLHYTHDGIYKSSFDFVVKPGDIYELYAKVDDKSIYSITQVPFPPKIISAQYGGNKYIQANVSSMPNEVIGAGWLIMYPNTNDILDTSPDFQNLVDSPGDTLSTVSVITMNIPDKYNTVYYSNYTYVQAYSFDPQYLRYFVSKNGNQPITNTFTQGGGQISWNVQGDNVIGLFIGLAVSTNYRVSNQ